MRRERLTLLGLGKVGLALPRSRFARWPHGAVGPGSALAHTLLQIEFPSAPPRRRLRTAVTAPSISCSMTSVSSDARTGRPTRLKPILQHRRGLGVASVCQPSTFRMLIWPEASAAHAASMRTLNLQGVVHARHTSKTPGQAWGSITELAFT